jgi:glycosyltransferase involved in cell wall biosynthesis
MQPDIICFSHLRWDFVYQRPQHLMSRLAASHRVFYIEEPVFDVVDGPTFSSYTDDQSNVLIITPHLPSGLDNRQATDEQRTVVDALLTSQGIKHFILWYYTPMAWPYSDHLSALCRVYDCMDELSAFLFAPAALKANEATLLQVADIVFTGGKSLYQAKRLLHHHVHAFPSSIDKAHFQQAREAGPDPDDQANIPAPRIGFYGVIDERLDIAMLGQISAMRPDWHFILIGPVVKIDASLLPRKDNIHYLGRKDYKDLPRYLSGWDLAMMPFALNESTKFISPTKTPEYLAGGKPVISPSIKDVVDPYGELGLVKLADTPEEFIVAAEEIFNKGISAGWLAKVDQFLSGRSWEQTVSEMSAHIENSIKRKLSISGKVNKFYV